MESDGAVDVSIVLPVFNAEDFLCEALDSLLAQDFLASGRCEIVAVDDGSTDRSRAILKEYEDKKIIPFKLILLDNNQGIVNALNAILDHCRGKYIARMDADDIATPDRLRRQVDFLEAHPDIDLVGGSVLMFKHGTKLVKKIDAPSSVGATMIDMFCNCTVAHPTVMARREFFSSRRYQEQFRIAEDYHLWLMAIVQSDVKITNLPPPHILRLRKHTANESKVRSELQIEKSKQALSSALQIVFEKLGQSPPAPCGTLASFMFYDKMPHDLDNLQACVSTLLALESFIFSSRGSKFSSAEQQELKSHVSSRLGAYAAHELKLRNLPASECPIWRIWLARSPSSQWFNLITSIQPQSAPAANPAPAEVKTEPAAAPQRRRSVRTDKVTVICFSKDRSFQLREYLRTLLEYCKPTCTLDVIVLWKAGAPRYRESYLKLADKFSKAVKFVEETVFSQQLMEMLRANTADFVLWGVDDVLWYRPFDIKEAMDIMVADPSILTTHFRLSPNVTYCHPSNAHSVLPKFEPVNGSSQFYKYDRTTATEDWNYPFELCATLMYKEDVIATLDSVKIWFGEDALSHPNKLEVSGARLFSRNLHEKNHLKYCLCMQHPIMSVITVNRVQDVCENRVYDEVSLEELDDYYRSGREFDLDYYRSRTFDAVHIGDCVLLPLQNV